MLWKVTFNKNTHAIFVLAILAGACGDETVDNNAPEPQMPGGPSTEFSVFIQPTLECSDPLPGEPAGQSENGQVCTWQIISGATEAGRRFSDYASCDVVRTQRPYYPMPPSSRTGQPDPRMDDPTYVTELDWVRTQIEATGCVCCHSAKETPMGASNWDIDVPGNWINTFDDTGLALGANLVSSMTLGAYEAEDNNGFDRSISGIPSTDPERMRTFFLNEIEHRGLTPEDFADTPPFGGFIFAQSIYQPTACENGEGIRADGTIEWEGGPARYIYVLEPGSDNPLGPPNFDLPEGTIWRLDVPSTGQPVLPGTVTFGTVPEGLLQTFPASGAPASLESGKTYYLYVSRDVSVPMTRCLFVAK